MELTERQTPRDVETITREIKDLQRQAQGTMVAYAVEIGRRLKEAKSLLPYGEWGIWLKDKVAFSQSTANNFMRVFDEYGDRQLTIFGAVADSQTIANLPYTKALRLLALPEEEREEMAEQAEDMSVKELEKAIRERNEARAEKEEAVKREQEARIAEQAARDKAEQADALKQKADELEAKLQAAQEKANTLKDKLKKAKENPTLPPEALEKIRQEAAEQAKEEAQAALEKELSETKKLLDDAMKQKTEAIEAARAKEEALDAARKKLLTASPEITKFKTIFDSVQEQAGKLILLREQIRADSPETADKLQAALNALAERLKEE